MAGPRIALPEVDAAQVTLVMDNSIDMLMASTDVAKRFPLGPNPFERPQPMAEHGFSAFIRVKQGGSKGSKGFIRFQNHFSVAYPSPPSAAPENPHSSTAPWRGGLRHTQACPLVSAERPGSVRRSGGGTWWALVVRGRSLRAGSRSSPPGVA